MPAPKPKIGPTHTYRSLYREADRDKVISRLEANADLYLSALEVARAMEIDPSLHIACQHEKIMALMESVVDRPSRDEPSPPEEDVTADELKRRSDFNMVLRAYMVENFPRNIPPYVIRDPEAKVAMATRHINYAGLVTYLWRYLTPALVYYQDQMSKDEEPAYTDQGFEFLADYILAFHASERPRFSDSQLGMLIKIARNAGIVSKDYTNTILDNYHTLHLTRQFAQYEALAEEKRMQAIERAKKKRNERRQ